MSEATDLLISARDKILDPESWGQGFFRHFNDLSGDYEYCADGALQGCKGAYLRLSGHWGYTPLGQVARRFLFDAATELAAERNLTPSPKSNISQNSNMIALVNDKTDHATVMEMYDRAIRKSKEADESAE